MALKQADQIRFDALKQMVGTLAKLGHDADTVRASVESMIQEFEASSKMNVRIGMNFEIELIDRTKDFMRIRESSEHKVLRSKVSGVNIEVKLRKDSDKGDDYKNDNATVADSLRELASHIDKMSEQMHNMPHCEVADYLDEIEAKREEQEETIAPSEDAVQSEIPADSNDQASEDDSDDDFRSFISGSEDPLAEDDDSSEDVV